jgi:hypothetical protein
MSGALELGTVGLIASTVCLGAYIYAFIWKPVGGRWLQIVGLISTLLALALLSCDLRIGSAMGASLNRVGAEAFLVVAAMTQSVAALRRRRGVRRREAPAEMELAAQPANASI